MQLPRVDILYAHANMDADLIDAAIKNGAKGIVVAGVGDGNMTKPALDALAEGREGRRRRRPQHAPADGHGPAQQRSQRRQARLRRLRRTQPRQVPRAAQLALTQTKDPIEIQKMFYAH